MFFDTRTEGGTDDDRPPKLLELHIVWPWSKMLMTNLSSSLFCDATYNVTVYEYKVVCITTLDGNNQLRPLMTSFITSSTKEAWQRIFDHFADQVMADPPQMVVVTSDKEQAIMSGLDVSKLGNDCVHLFCGLHTKWNVQKHK